MENSPSTIETKEGPKNILKFESWSDYLEKQHTRTSSRAHVDDIEIGGILASSIEKNHIQQESTSMALKYLAECLKRLGIRGRALDPKRITFVDRYSLRESAQWSVPDDWVIIPSFNEGSVGSVVHEGFHSLSSEWQYRAQEYLDSLPQDRTIKTGFSSTRQGRTTSRSNFDLLNEAITEKMTQETIEPHTQEIEYLNKSSNRAAYHLDFIEEAKQKAMERVHSEIKQKIEGFKKEEVEEIENIRKRIKERIENQVREMTEEGVSQEVIQWMVDSDTEFMELDITWEKEKTEMRSKMEQGFEGLEETWWDGLKKGVQGVLDHPTSRDSYQTGIEILDLILEGLTCDEAKGSGKPEEEVRQEIWTDMQQAYFNGNVMWLRKIEKVFGNDALYAIATVPHPALEIFDEKKRSEEVKELLRQAVQEIRQRTKENPPLQKV